MLLQSARPLAMQFLADRFLLDDMDVVDLATGELVRLTIDRDATSVSERLAHCDAIAPLRHPLLLPLLDYGLVGTTWFEAYASVAPYRGPGDHARAAALHLVRFLRAHGVELTAAAAARCVRPAIDAPIVARRIIGYRLVWRRPLDVVRLLLEAGGPPGVACVTVCGAVGSGLRTSRMLLARAARAAGYFVVDSRFSALVMREAAGRHCCVIDWLPARALMPAVLAQASVSGAARHIWLRFTRGTVRGDGAVALDSMMPAEMSAMVYRDAELGPEPGDVHDAARASRGWPGSFLERLTVPRGSAQPMWVHESVPEYRVLPPPAETSAQTDAAGNLDLERADTALSRARASEALAAYRAIAERRAGDVPPELAIRIGRASIALGQRAGAEAALRLAIVSGNDRERAEASSRLALSMAAAGDIDRASELLEQCCPSEDPRLDLARGTLALARHDLGAAAVRLLPLIEAPVEPAVRAEAHLTLARLRIRLGERERAHEHARAAHTLARGSRDAGLQLISRAAMAVTSAAPVRPAVWRRIETATRHLPDGTRADVLPWIAANGGPVSSSGVPSDGDTLEELLGIAHAATDDQAAVRAVAERTADMLHSCSLAVWLGQDLRQAVLHGRPWAGGAGARATVNAGRGTFLRGVLVEATETIRAGGMVIGCIGARWASGCAPAEGTARRLLRLAAAAMAPAVAVLGSPPAAPPAKVGSPDELFGMGERADRLRSLIARASGAPFPVLIEGESGSGKELVARAIHARSARRGRRFSAVNCAALTEDLLEAELFGHTRGAFTGASSERAGLFEEADQGTLFLDEVAELSPRGQAKLLRVLQEGEVRRIGENMPRRVDVRIVAATNRPLEGEVEAGRFRADLRFRLDVIRITVPPLRERADEVAALAERIWAEAASRVGTRATLGREVIGALARYAWPGNVRELQNVLAALAVQAPPRGRVPVSLLPARIAECAGRRAIKFEEARLEFERSFVQAALARAAGRKNAAAQQLGVTRQGLDKMLKRLGLVESA